MTQCRQVLSTLGYRKDLISIDNLKRILGLVRDVLSNRHESSPSSTSSTESASDPPTETTNWDAPGIMFEEFCVISSYLSVLQHEIEENCCVSPIKGTNLPPPPIFLTNAPGRNRKIYAIEDFFDPSPLFRNDAESLSQAMFAVIRGEHDRQHLSTAASRAEPKFHSRRLTSSHNRNSRRAALGCDDVEWAQKRQQPRFGYVIAPTE